MMKKLKPLWIFLGIIIVLWIIGRVTNALQFYNIPSGANYPTLQVGDKIFSTNLRSPGRDDFICFRAEDEFFGKHIRVYRVAGIEGDRIEIRNSVMFVNGKNADSLLDLAHYYVLSRDQMVQLQQHEEIPGEMILEHGTDSFKLILHTGQIKKYGLKVQRLIYSPEDENRWIAEQFGKPWNSDHFGPVEVPPGSFFVMGDNRHEAEDSRYKGFVLKKDVIGTVLGK